MVQTSALAGAAACGDHDTDASHHSQRACCGLACSASGLIVAGGFPEAPPANLAAPRVLPKGDAQVSASRLYRPPNAWEACHTAPGVAIALARPPPSDFLSVENPPMPTLLRTSPCSRPCLRRCCHRCCTRDPGRRRTRITRPERAVPSQLRPARPKQLGCHPLPLPLTTRRAAA